MQDIQPVNARCSDIKVRRSWGRPTTTSLILALVCLAATACGSSNSATSTSTPASSGTTASTAAKSPMTFVMIPAITTDPGYITMRCGAEAEAKRLGVRLDYAGSSTVNPAVQSTIVQSLLADHPSALLLTPDDPTALEPVVEQYRAKKIPVLTLDTTVKDPALLVSRITSSGTQGGTAAADALAKSIGDKGEVGLVASTPTSTTDNSRVDSFKAEIKAKYPGITVIGIEYSNDSIATGATVARAMLLAHPNLKGIFAVDGNSATGTANAIAAAGDKGKVILAGYDAEPPVVKLLENGSIDITVIQDFATEGKLGVEYAYDDLSGKQADIKPAVDLSNIVATQENVHDPSITKYFYRPTC